MESLAHELLEMVYEHLTFKELRRLVGMSRWLRDSAVTYTERRWPGITHLVQEVVDLDKWLGECVRIQWLIKNLTCTERSYLENSTSNLGFLRNETLNELREKLGIPKPIKIRRF